MLKYLNLFIFSLFFTGCAVNSNFLSDDFVDKMNKKEEIKIILIEDTINDFQKEIFLILKNLDWKVIRHKGDIRDVEWNVTYDGLPKYVLNIEREQTWEDYKSFEIFYNISIKDIQKNEFVMEISGIDRDKEILNIFKKTLLRIK